jgi:heme-degrading protein
VAQGGIGLRTLALRGATPIDGGFPIIADGKIIGAIGVSGAAGNQDAQVAKAGADAGATKVSVRINPDTSHSALTGYWPRLVGRAATGESESGGFYEQVAESPAQKAVRLYSVSAIVVRMAACVEPDDAASAGEHLRPVAFSK